jgi:ubiquinone/menaquinone biosynthesis C-methylase UbiE
MDEYGAFASTYDAWAADMTDDVQWYVALAREAAEPVIELAVGSGRVAIPIARATGKRVIGIDRSPAMLAVARERSEGLPIELREGDMRDLAVDEPLRLVICPFRSLMHLPTWDDKRRVFERVAGALQPGGRFAWNAFVFSPQIAARLDGQHVDRADGLWEETRYVAADSRIEITRGRGDETIGTLRIWWSTKAEWDGLIEAAGLELEALYGGFHREPFDDSSLEMVWVARKP